MKKRFLVLAVIGAVALVAAIPGALARPGADPGITPRSITIGSTLPLSGAASLYARIGTGMRAYFSYINARRARDGKRGVYGRQIVLKIYDDQYQEAQTVQQTRRAVEQDRVFAMLGGLGTENQQAVRAYLNQRKVPQLYVSTGLSEFGRQIRQFPWTIGWQPDYVQEGILLGRYLRQNTPNARVAVLRQNDDYGKEFLAGFERGAGAGPGFGLGLPIARGLARRMGGDVAAQPTPRGAMLVATLPACPAPATPAPDEQPAPVPTG
jgi:ABC-type branched-subunit amino acid transport system substrate-binding protein